MNAKPFDWLKLGVTLVAVAVVTEFVALLMNATGDCGPGVEHCGETARQLSFVVLGVGAIWPVYLIIRFVRDHRR